MSNLVIVAIPDENERVWKVSSEKIPHMTLLFLGDVDEVKNLEDIIGFVEHAASTTLCRFSLPVDYRGELGEDQADVLFFKKNRYDYKAVRDFRANLLQDSNIKTAYDSATQFDGVWQPHLTLGYPATPAKEPDDEWGSTFYSIGFDKIAVWMGDFDGPEFRLKDYWDEYESLETVPGDVAMSDLHLMTPEQAIEHFGTKGMRWGQRKTETVTTDSGKKKMVTAKKAEKLDRKWEKNQFTLSKGIERHNAMADYMNGRLGGLNDKFKKDDFAKELFDSPETWSPRFKQYMDEYHGMTEKAFVHAVEKVHGTSPTGKKRAIVEHQGDEMQMVIKDVDAKHASIDDGDEVFLFKIGVDEKGRIVSMEPIQTDEMEQTTELGAGFVLEHFGVKGMRWGVRNDNAKGGGASRTGAKASVGSVAKKTGGALVKAGKFAGDVNFERRVSSSEGHQSVQGAIHSKARQAFKRTDLPAIKARHGEYGKLRNRAKNPFSKEAKAYRKDARETYINRLEEVANSMTNVSGTRQYTIRERGWELPAEGGNLPKSKTYWEVTTRSIKHADGDDEFTFLVEVVTDDEGYITDLKPEVTEASMAQTADLGLLFLAHVGVEVPADDRVIEFLTDQGLEIVHYGTKGMRWGFGRSEGPQGFASEGWPRPKRQGVKSEPLSILEPSTALESPRRRSPPSRPRAAKIIQHRKMRSKWLSLVRSYRRAVSMHCPTKSCKRLLSGSSWRRRSTSLRHVSAHWDKDSRSLSSVNRQVDSIELLDSRSGAL